MKTETCSIYVYGIEIACPLCGVTVQSGIQHFCEKRDTKARKPTAVCPAKARSKGKKQPR